MDEVLEQTVNPQINKAVVRRSCLTEQPCLLEMVTACPDQKVQCPGSSECCDAWELCDGCGDCEDGLDNAHCPQDHCLAGQWRCKNKVCVMESSRCDGINDCGDSSDEDLCGESCPPPFTQREGRQAVKDTYHMMSPIRGTQ